jgi:hypothetical protein
VLLRASAARQSSDATFLESPFVTLPLSHVHLDFDKLWRYVSTETYFIFSLQVEFSYIQLRLSLSATTGGPFMSVMPCVTRSMRV